MRRLESRAIGLRFGENARNLSRKPFFETMQTFPITRRAAMFVAATLSGIQFSTAEILHQWDFEDPTLFLAPSQTIGGGALTIPTGSPADVVPNTASQNFTTAHLRVNNPLGDPLGDPTPKTLRFAVPTTGHAGVSVSFQTRRSGQGAGMQTLAYTTNGSTWTVLASYEVLDADPQTKAFSLAHLPAVNNNPQFGLRITFALGDGGTAGNNRFDNFTVTTNLAPVVTGQVPARLDVIETGGPTHFAVAPWFDDPEDDPLSFAAVSSLPAVATASISGGQLVIHGLARGDAEVTVTASDGNSSTAATVRVLVHPQARPLAAGDASFGEWDDESPERTYPPHMLFLQGAENDSTLTTELDRAYHLAPADYHEDDIGNIGYPYMNTRRTRINGLDADGVAFLNTGSGRDLGGALLALDTTGVSGARVGFLAGTLVPNTRVYAIRLQYRLGTSGAFSNVLDGANQPVEYTRHDTAGHSAIFGPITLPAALLGKPYVQLLWRYYYSQPVPGETGARAQLRLDDILVTSEMDSAPASLAFDPAPRGSQSGVALPPFAVRVYDAGGFPVTSFNGPVTLSLTGSGTLSGTTTVSAVAGVASFDHVIITGVGGQQLKATAAGAPPQASPPFRTLALSGLLIPRFIQGEQDVVNGNIERVPFAWYARIEGLAPHATYRYANSVVLAVDAATSEGAGNMVFVTGAGSDWIRTTSSPRFRAGDVGSRCYEFTAGADGSYSGWFVTEPSGNTRFTPGYGVFPRLLLNDGEDGEQTAIIVTAPESAEVKRFGSATAEGSGIRGESATAARRMALLFDETAGASRPLAATPVEITGAEVDDRYTAFYRNEVATVQSRWGALIPNALPNGVRRIEIRDVTTGVVVDALTHATGFTGTVNGVIRSTVNPNSGTTPIVLNLTAGLPVFNRGDSGKWNNTGNWTPATVPNGAAQTAIINAPTAGDRNVNIDAHIIIGAIRFNQAATHYRNRLRRNVEDPVGTLTFNGGTLPGMIRIDGAGGTGHVDFDLDTSVTLATTVNLLVNQIDGSPDYGALRLQGTWNGTGGLTKQGPGLATLTGPGKSFAGAVLVEQGALAVTAPAAPAAASAVDILAGGQLRLTSTGSRELPASYLFGGGAVGIAGQGRSGVPDGAQFGVLGAIRYEPGADADHHAALTNPVALLGPADIHVGGASNSFAIDGPLSGAFELAKSGAGTLILNGTSEAGAPNLEIDNGTIMVNGSHPAPVDIDNGSFLSGAGLTGPITGRGTVSPGTDTLTAPTSAAENMAFVLTTPGATAGNGALALTAPEPLAIPPLAIKLFLDHAAPQPGDRFAGGLVVPAAYDLAGALAVTTVELFVADPAGSVSYNGRTYRSAEPADLLTWSVAEIPGGRALEVLKGGTPVTYGQWRNLGFTDFGERTDDAVSGPLAQPAGDGISNLLRYACGVGPGEPVLHLLPTLTPPAASGAIFRFRYDAAKTDLVWRVKASTDLVTWPHTLFDSAGDPIPPLNDGWLPVAVPPALTGGATPDARQFVRLELELK